MKKKRLVVDLPAGVHAKFTRMVDRHGFKKRKIIEVLVNDWCLKAEADPEYFNILKDNYNAPVERG